MLILLACLYDLNLFISKRRYRIRNGIAEGEAIQVEAISTLKDKGVKIHKWSEDILNTLETAWLEVVAEESARDEDFKRSWNSLSTFRKDIATWKSLGYLN